MVYRHRWNGTTSLIGSFVVPFLSIWMGLSLSSTIQAQPLKEAIDGSATLTGIDIEEAARSASVAFLIDDPSNNPAIDYKVASSVRLSRKWIDLILPAVRAGIRGNVASGGEVLGDVLVEETPVGAGTRISIEILAVSVDYIIRQKNGVLIFSLTVQ